jgi:drug/metabolite transporter, DME family
MSAINQNETSNSTTMNFGPMFIAMAATLWTTDFFARSYLTQIMSSTLIVMYEHIIITILLLPLLYAYRDKLFKFTPIEWGALLVIGIGASAVATIALTSGYALGFLIYGPVVALTQQFQPVIAIGLAHILLKERLPKNYYILSVIAIFGVFLMYWPLVGRLSISELAFSTGILAAVYGLTAATLWATGTVFGKYMLQHSKSELEFSQLTVFRFTIGMIFLVIFNLAYQPITANLSVFSDSRAILYLLFLAFIPGLLSLILYYYGLKTTHASIATLFELAFPLSFFIFVPLIVSAVITPIQFIGAIILIAATTYLSYTYGKQGVEHEKVIST